MLRKFFLAAVLFLNACNIAIAQNSSTTQWQMQPIAIQTRWAKGVSPTNVLPEYPRPQMVRENNWQNLNGLWEYAITKIDSNAPSKFDGKILVPFPIESALSGVKKPLLPTQNIWYKKEIKKPNLKTGERSLLHFGAVDWQTTVFINGKEVGKHNGGYTSFTIDITDYLTNEENELLVKVFDPTDKGINPHGKQTLTPGNIYYTPSSGIWQTVWLETVPFDYISGLELLPDIDKSVVSITVKTSHSCTVELIAKDKDTIISKVIGKTGIPIRLKIKRPKLWSPENPFLYDLSVKIINDNKTVDEVKSYFGMRKVNISKDENGVDRIFLNNKPYFNLGTLDQGFWPDGLYTPPSDAALKFDLEAIKSMGFNTVRKHIKVEPERWYYYADKIGLLVWQDFVNPPQQPSEDAKIEFEKETKEIINQLYNFPSISTWVLFNEKWGQYDQKRLTKWIKQSDHSRIINGHSGEYLYVNNELRSPSPDAYVDADLTDVHSYPNPMLSIKQEGKAMVCGEFGGIGVPVPGHQWDDLNGWGYVQVKPKELEEKYAGMMKSIKSLKEKGLSACIYTQPFDVEGEENGLITYDRDIIKIPIINLRDIHKGIVNLNKDLAFNLHFKEISHDISNQNDQYAELLTQYDKGQRDSLFLRKLLLMSIKMKNQLRSTQIGNSYIRALNNLYSKGNIDFINKITRTSNDTGFNIFLNNKDSINKILGDNSAEATTKAIIFTEIIAPLREKRIKVEYDKIENETIGKYGTFAEIPTWNALSGFAWETKDVSNFVKYKNKIYEKYPDDVSMFYLNNDAWFIFENSSKITDLEIALSWQEKVIKNDSLNPNAFDTYANILHKLGRTKEAIKWEEKAVEMDPNSPGKKGALEKMKREAKF